MCRQGISVRRRSIRQFEEGEIIRGCIRSIKSAKEKSVKVDYLLLFLNSRSWFYSPTHVFSVSPDYFYKTWHFMSPSYVCSKYSATNQFVNYVDDLWPFNCRCPVYPATGTRRQNGVVTTLFWLGYNVQMTSFLCRVSQLGTKSEVFSLLRFLFNFCQQ